MDLLKDITSELRGRDERTNDREGTDDGDPGPADDAATDTESVARSTTATGESGAGDESKSNDETARADEKACASGNRDDHLCSFCETEFDASRNVCPECGAEIVIRGAQ